MLLVCLVPGSAAAQSGDLTPVADGPRVVIAFLPLPEGPRVLDDGVEPPLAFRPILDRLAARDQLSIGMSSAAQGQYDPIQALLDITQGTRVSLSGYHPKRPPELTLYTGGDDHGGLFQGWLEQVTRADSAPADVVSACSPARSPAAPRMSASTAARSARRS